MNIIERVWNKLDEHRRNMEDKLLTNNYKRIIVELTLLITYLSTTKIINHNIILVYILIYKFPLLYYL